MGSLASLKLVAKGPACLGEEQHTFGDVMYSVELPDGGRRWLMSDACVYDWHLKEVPQ